MANVRSYTDKEVLDRIESKAEGFNGWKKGMVVDVWIRSATGNGNEFNDKVFTYECTQDGVRPEYIMKCSGTSHAGLYYQTQRFLNPEGCAVVLGDIFIENSHTFGKHRGYPAYVQNKEVPVTRDNDKDGIAENYGKVTWGWFGINCHRASEWKKVYTIGRYSAGCLVRNDPAEWKKWLKFMNERLLSLCVLNEWTPTKKPNGIKINTDTIEDADEYTISQKGIDFIQGYEKKRLTVYKDQGGLLTVGWGHLVTKKDNLKLGNTISEERCEQFWQEDKKEFENVVNKWVKVPLGQNQFDALVALAFNIGEGDKQRGIDGFSTSTVLRELNQGFYENAANAFLLWNKVTINGVKQVSRGLVNRRAKEREMFLLDSALPTAEPTPTHTAEIPTDKIPDSEYPSEVEPENSDETPETEKKDITAPAKEYSEETATKISVGGFVVPPTLIIIYKTIEGLIVKGYVSAQDIGNAAIGFITENSRYFFYLLIAIVIGLMLKKAWKQISFMLQMWINANPKMNDINIVPDVSHKAIEKLGWRKRLGRIIGGS